MMLFFRVVVLALLLPGQTLVATHESLAAADAQLRLGKYGEAARLYQEILHDNPKADLAAVGLVHAFLKQEQVARALDAAKEAVATDPDSPSAHTALADVYFRQADFLSAEHEYKRALQLDHSVARAWWGMGRIFLCNSMRKSAKVAFENAYALDPSDPDIVKDWAETRTLNAEKIGGLERYLAIAAGADRDELTEARDQLALRKAIGSTKTCVLSTPYVSSEMKIDVLKGSPGQPGGYALKASINGNKPIKLQLDTGAGHGIYLSPRTAARLGVRRLADAHFHGVGDRGSVPGYMGVIDTLRVGGVEYHNCPVGVGDRNVPVDEGLVGTVVFSQFLITLDLPHARLRLDPLPGEQVPPNDEHPLDRSMMPRLQAFTPVYTFSGMLLVPTRINHHSAGLFVLDTGGSANSISVSLARNAANAQRDLRLRVQGIAGNVNQTYVADDVLVEFAHFGQENVAMASFDFSGLSRQLQTEVSGILGWPLLDKFAITLDYRDGLVKFKYSK